MSASTPARPILSAPLARIKYFILSTTLILNIGKNPSTIKNPKIYKELMLFLDLRHSNEKL